MIYLKKKLSFFFLPRLLQFHFRNKWSKHSFSIDWAPHRRLEIHVLKELESRGCLLDMCAGCRMGRILNQYWPYFKSQRSRGGGGSIPGCQPRLPRATYMCIHVISVETLRQKQRRCVYCRRVDCVGCLVATSNSCLCEWQTLMYVTTASWQRGCESYDDHTQVTELCVHTLECIWFRHFSLLF